MIRPREDWADLMYNGPHGKLAHIVPFGQPYSLCGGSPLGLQGWYGTGTMDEFDKAASLPVCGKCKATADE